MHDARRNLSGRAPSRRTAGEDLGEPARPPNAAVPVSAEPFQHARPHPFLIDVVTGGNSTLSCNLRIRGKGEGEVLGKITGLLKAKNVI